MHADPKQVQNAVCATNAVHQVSIFRMPTFHFAGNMFADTPFHDVNGAVP